MNRYHVSFYRDVITVERHYLWTEVEAETDEQAFYVAQAKLLEDPNPDRFVNSRHIETQETSDLNLSEIAFLGGADE